MNEALEALTDKRNWYLTTGGVWECVSASIDIDAARAELERLRWIATLADVIMSDPESGAVGERLRAALAERP